jgi:SHAQKYF class myb-like DNA-binding protein
LPSRAFVVAGGSQPLRRPAGAGRCMRPQHPKTPPHRRPRPRAPPRAGQKGARTAPKSWSEEEEAKFQQALEQHGRDWKACAAHIGSRDSRAVASHAQKHFIRLCLSGTPLPAKVAESGLGWTLSGKLLDPNSSAARAYGFKKELLDSGWPAAGRWRLAAGAGAGGRCRLAAGRWPLAAGCWLLATGAEAAAGWLLGLMLLMLHGLALAGCLPEHSPSYRLRRAGGRGAAGGAGGRAAGGPAGHRAPAGPGARCWPSGWPFHWRWSLRLLLCCIAMRACEGSPGSSTPEQAAAQRTASRQQHLTTHTLRCAPQDGNPIPRPTPAPKPAKTPKAPREPKAPKEPKQPKQPPAKRRKAEEAAAGGAPRAACCCSSRRAGADRLAPLGGSLAARPEQQHALPAQARRGH